MRVGRTDADEHPSRLGVLADLLLGGTLPGNLRADDRERLLDELTDGVRLARR